MLSHWRDGGAPGSGMLGASGNSWRAEALSCGASVPCVRVRGDDKVLGSEPAAVRTQGQPPLFFILVACSDAAVRTSVGTDRPWAAQG